MYNFDPYNVLLSIATNIPVLLMTAFVLQGHISVYLSVYLSIYLYWTCIQAKSESQLYL